MHEVYLVDFQVRFISATIECWQVILYTCLYYLFELFYQLFTFFNLDLYRSNQMYSLNKKSVVFFRNKLPLYPIVGLLWIQNMHRSSQLLKGYKETTMQ